MVYKLISYPDDINFVQYDKALCVFPSAIGREQDTSI